MSSYQTIYNNAKRQFAPAFKKELDKQVRQVLETGDCEGDGMKQTIRKLHASLGTLMAHRTNMDIRRQVNQKASTPQEIWRKVILLYLEQFGLDKLTGDIADTTKTDILKILQSGVIDGLTINQQMDYIEQLGYTSYRAELISRTETAKSANTGSMVGAISTGLQTRKEWISIQGARTRRIPRDQFDHFNLDGVQVAFDESFKVQMRDGGYIFMLHPGDPNAPAGSVCNCRCTIGFEAVRDANGAPKRLTSPPIGNAGIIYQLLQAQKLTA